MTVARHSFGLHFFYFGRFSYNDYIHYAVTQCIHFCMKCIVADGYLGQS